MTDRIAIIDVGSNSVRLLAAELVNDEIRRLKGGLITTRLIEGMEDNRLTDAAIERTAGAIAVFAEEARKLGIERIDAFGTSAMRDAVNSGKVSELTKRMCGIEVSVISGDEEACTAFRGVAPSGKVGVIDIGGGSTELVTGENGNVMRSMSGRIGAVRLKDRLKDALDPQLIRETAAQTMKEVCDNALQFPPESWIGVGGSIKALAAADIGTDDHMDKSLEGHALTIEKTDELFEILCRMSVEERRNIRCIPPARADIIPYGAGILSAVMHYCNIPAVRTSLHDNLEGRIRTLIKGV